MAPILKDVDHLHVNVGNWSKAEEGTDNLNAYKPQSSDE